MAFPNAYIGDIVATTLENRSKKAADNVTRNNALLNRIDKKGNARAFIDGGREIWQEIEYAQNGTIGWYSGYDQLNVSPQNIMTAATFPIRQAAAAVSISGLEELQNSGEEKTINLVATRVKNAESTLTALIAQGIYSDGTTAKSIGGLQYLVSTTTGSVGGIDSGTWPFWANTAYGAITNGGAATTAANIRRYMDSIWVQQVRGTDKPNLLVGDNTTWRLFNESLQPLQRITDAEMAAAGFTTLEYMGSPVVLDGGFQGNTGDPVPTGGAPSGYLYFLNTDYIQYRPHADRNFVPLNPDRYSINQDAVVKLMAWAGNCTVSNRRLQAVLYPT